METQLENNIGAKVPFIILGLCHSKLVPNVKFALTNFKFNTLQKRTKYYLKKNI